MALTPRLPASGCTRFREGTGALRLIERAFDRHFEAMQRREQSALKAWQVALVLVACFVAIGLDFFADSFGWHRSAWWAFASLPYGMLAGLGVAHATGISRRLAWRRGYRHGRDAMIASIGEAMRRDMTFADWLAGEMQRDGLAHAVKLDDDGHVIAIGLPFDNGDD